MATWSLLATRAGANSWCNRNYLKALDFAVRTRVKHSWWCATALGGGSTKGFLHSGEVVALRKDWWRLWEEWRQPAEADSSTVHFGAHYSAKLIILNCVMSVPAGAADQTTSKYVEGGKEGEKRTVKHVYIPNKILCATVFFHYVK